MQFFRLTPNPLHLDSAAWRRSREQRECCVAACCEAGARQAASLLMRAEGVPAGPEDAATPWELPGLVTCATLPEVPAVTTDPRLTAAHRIALQQGRPTEVPALAAQPAPVDGATADARLGQALAALAEVFRAAGHAEAGQRVLETVRDAWAATTPQGAATPPTPTGAAISPTPTGAAISPTPTGAAMSPARSRDRFAACAQKA